MDKDYKNILDKIPAGVFFLKGKQFNYFNDRLLDILGYARDEFQQVDIVDIVHTKDKNWLKEKLSSGLTPDSQFSRELELVRKDNRYLWVLLNLKVLEVEPEALIIGTVNNIQSQKEKLEELKNLIVKDKVTEVYNEEGLVEQLQARFARDQRENKTGAILALELEGLDKFQKEYGKAFLNKILTNFAKNLQGFIRESDLIARTGDKKFIIFLDSFNNSLDAATVADRLNEKFEEPREVEDQKVKIDFKMGVAVFPNDGKDPNKLISNANQSLKSIKKTNKVYLFFNEEINKMRLARQKIVDKIRSALQNDRILPYYQPIISRDGRMHRFEALARLITKSGKMIPAENFIPTAEETGLVEQIDDIMLDKVFRTIKKWKEEGHQVKGSLNISSLEFDNGLYEKINSKLRELELSPESVYLEITEDLLLKSSKSAIKKVEKLRDLGVRFSIDNFGIGSSSLSRLHYLPIDEIKVDKSFVDFKGSVAKSNRSIIKSALEIARAKEVELVIEGVESQSAMETLFQLGCNYIQGYYFKKPLPEQAFSNLIGRYSVDDFKREFWI